MLSRRLWLGLAVAAVAATPLAARMPESRTTAVDAAVRQLVDGNSTPGVVVLILQDGQPIYQRAHGLREAGGSAPIAMTDMFRLASMTKVITSTAALMLVEQQRIKLDDPVANYLPEFAHLRVRQADGNLAATERAPTIRDLMSHTAGFSYNFMNAPGVVAAYRDAGVTDGLATSLSAEEAARRLAMAPLRHQPGREFHYSLATDVLGWVIERVSGQRLGHFVADRIARPLNLSTLAFQVPAAQAERFVPVTPPSRVLCSASAWYRCARPRTSPSPPLEAARCSIPTVPSVRAMTPAAAAWWGRIADYPASSACWRAAAKSTACASCSPRPSS